MSEKFTIKHRRTNAVLYEFDLLPGQESGMMARQMVRNCHQQAADPAIRPLLARNDSGRAHANWVRASLNRGVGYL